MPPDTASFRMADRLAGGNLAAIISQLRTEGISYQRIAQRLHTDFGIEITSQTVLNWADQMKPEPSDAA